MARPKGKTPPRSIRVHDDLWLPAMAIAKILDDDLSGAVVRPALERYVKRNRHLLEDVSTGDVVSQSGRRSP